MHMGCFVASNVHVEMDKTIGQSITSKHVGKLLGQPFEEHIPEKKHIQNEQVPKMDVETNS